MSWSISGINAPVGEAEAAIDAAIAGLGSQAEGSTAQLEAARAAAMGLVASVARPGDSVAITMVGHSNPDGAPRLGWADQMVHVIVAQVPAKAEG